MNIRTSTTGGLLAVLAALLLAACDAGPKAPAATATSPAAAASAREAEAPSVADAGEREEDTSRRAEAEVPTVDGKPMWSANRRRSAEENAMAQFERNGAEFGARSVDDYVAKAHAFVSEPPAGVERLRRANGDTLLYDARSNTFAVVTRAGAPRTLFKPREGATYWAEQKDREQQRTARRRDRDDDAG